MKADIKLNIEKSRGFYTYEIWCSGVRPEFHRVSQTLSGCTTAAVSHRTKIIFGYRYHVDTILSNVDCHLTWATSSSEVLEDLASLPGVTLVLSPSNGHYMKFLLTSNEHHSLLAFGKERKCTLSARMRWRWLFRCLSILLHALNGSTPSKCAAIIL